MQSGLRIDLRLLRGFAEVPAAEAYSSERQAAQQLGGAGSSSRRLDAPHLLEGMRATGERVPALTRIGLCKVVLSSGPRIRRLDIRLPLLSRTVRDAKIKP